MFCKLVFLLNLQVKNWLKIQICIVKTIYAIDNVRHNTLQYWIDRLQSIFSNRYEFSSSGEAYISIGRKNGLEVEWVVKLPKNLKIRPAEKSFSYIRYEGSDKALKAAIDYRDNVLDNILAQL